MPNAFKPKEHKPVVGQGNWDEYYYDVQLVDKVIKIGEGEDDFSIIKKEVITKRKIKDVIDAQADDVGLDNILRKYALTGDESLLPESVNTNNEVMDFSGMPQDLIDADNYFKNMKAQFDALPDDLKQGRDFNAFMKTLTQAQFDAYISSLMPKEKEVKKGDGE